MFRNKKKAQIKNILIICDSISKFYDEIDKTDIHNNKDLYFYKENFNELISFLKNDIKNEYRIENELINYLEISYQDNDIICFEEAMFFTDKVKDIKGYKRINKLKYNNLILNKALITNNCVYFLKED